MIGIAENIPAKEESYELHRLLATILSSNLEANEKLDIMEREYHILLEDDIREEVEEMCNLSQGIKEKAYQGGYELGHENGYESGRESGYVEIIFKMYESGLPIEKITKSKFCAMYLTDQKIFYNKFQLCSNHSTAH